MPPETLSSQPALNSLENRRHLEITNNDDKLEPVRQCPYVRCAFKIRGKNAFQAHLKSAHPAYKPYLCTVCQKRFKWKCNYTTHMRIHTGIKPYKCPYCAIDFRHVNSLRRHLNSCCGAQNATSLVYK